MTAPKTLLELAGADLNPPRLRDACLVLIDLQNEYLAGPIALPDAGPRSRNAVNAAGAGARRRSRDLPYRPQGTAGGLFDRAAERGAIVAELAPLVRRARDREGFAQRVRRH